MSIMIEGHDFIDAVVLEAIRIKAKEIYNRHKRVLAKQAEVKRTFEKQMEELKDEIEKLAKKKYEIEEAGRVLGKAMEGG